MTDPNMRLAERYFSRGVLVDTNILLLYFIGGYKPDEVPRFKRTRQFTVEDYYLLKGLLAPFKSVLTVPNILTEVNSLSGQMPQSAKEPYLGHFAKQVELLDEHYLASTDACRAEEFTKLGLTDSVIMELARDKYLVLTDDWKLYGYLESAGIDVMNFNHIRNLG